MQLLPARPEAHHADHVSSEAVSPEDGHCQGRGLRRRRVKDRVQDLLRERAEEHELHQDALAQVRTLSTDTQYDEGDSSIFIQSSNPVCGSSMTEQVRLSDVWPMENRVEVIKENGQSIQY